MWHCCDFVKHLGSASVLDTKNEVNVESLQKRNVKNRRYRKQYSLANCLEYEIFFYLQPFILDVMWGTKKCCLCFYLDMWSACPKVKTHCARISALRKKIIQISGFIATVECHGTSRHLRMRWTQWYSPKHLLTMWSILRDRGNDDYADNIMIKMWLYHSCYNGLLKRRDGDIILPGLAEHHSLYFDATFAEHLGVFCKKQIKEAYEWSSHHDSLKNTEKSKFLVFCKELIYNGYFATFEQLNSCACPFPARFCCYSTLQTWDGLYDCTFDKIPWNCKNKVRMR